MYKPKNSLLTEKDKTLPSTFYGKTKLMAENFLLKNNNDQQIIFKDYYSSFSETLKKFILMVKNHKKMANFDDIFGIARIVLQGQKAINNPGKKIYL